MIRRLALCLALIIPLTVHAQQVPNQNNSFGLIGRDSGTGLPCYIGGAATCGVPSSGGSGGGGPATGAVGSFVDGWSITDGSTPDAACATDNGTCSEIALLKRNAQRLTSMIAAIGTGDAATCATTNSLIACLRQLHTDLTSTLTFSGTVTMGAGANVVGLVQQSPGAPASINISSATTTQIVALTSAKSITITGGFLQVSAADNITFEYGTGSSCGTGTTTFSGAVNLLTAGIVYFPPATLPSGQAFCILTTTTAQASGYASTFTQ